MQRQEAAASQAFIEERNLPRFVHLAETLRSTDLAAIISVTS